MPLLGMETRDFVVLLTDGYQCCGVYRNENNQLRCEPEPGENGENRIVSRVRRLRELGITVYGGLPEVSMPQHFSVQLSKQVQRGRIVTLMQVSEMAINAIIRRTMDPRS